MKRLLTTGFVLALSVSVNAANVHVERMSNGGGSERGGGNSGGGAVSAGGNSPTYPSFQAGVTRVKPQRVHRSWWGHRTVRTTHVPATSYAAAGTGRVHVVPAANSWRAGYGYGRPYRYTYYRGHPWYGFSMGPRHYWARWYTNRWWWYDGQFARWAFWADGYWWYGAPGGLMYVYVNDTYVPYEPGVVPVAAPAAVTAPTDEEAPPPTVVGTPSASATQDLTATSPDGKRMVQIVGPNSEAFLYDMTSGKAAFMQYLVNDAARVRFSGGTSGQPLQILIDFKTNDRFAIFDMNGVAQGSSAPVSKKSSTGSEPPLPAPLPE